MISTRIKLVRIMRILITMMMTKMTTMSVKKMKIYPYPSEVTGLIPAALSKTILNLPVFDEF